MQQKRKKLTRSLIYLCVIPLLCCGAAVLVISSLMIYNSLKREIRHNLANMTYFSQQIYNYLYPGDFCQTGDMVTKGGVDVAQGMELVDEIRRQTGVDVTLFYESIRCLTTVRKADGSRVLNTRVQPEVEKKVLEQGEEYFSDSVLVNGEAYFGYYVPLTNTDGAITGMIFTGKPRRQVMREINRNILIVCLLEMAIISIVVFLVIHYGKRLIFSLQETETFLGKVAAGDLTAELEPYVLARRDEVGEMGRFAVMLRDSIVELVGNDPLTGLGNRRSCDTVLKHTAERAGRKGRAFTIVLGDIDYFKRVNDTYGHQAGDEVLKEMAALMQKHIKHCGFVFRWGGEEFLLIYEDKDVERAYESLKRLHDDIRSAVILWQKEEIRVTMTFGMAEYGHRKSLKELVRLADERLYQGKHQGRDQIVK